MRRIGILLALVSLPAAAIVACGDDSAYDSPDSGARTDGGGADSGGNGGDSGGSGDGASDASVSPPRVLVSYNGGANSELVVVGVNSKAVDGRLVYPGFLGITDSRGVDPFVLEESTDIVAKLDRVQPWVVTSSWSVHGTDDVDGSKPNADPASLVEIAGKAYVIRFNRNNVLTLDLTQVSDGGAPSGKIDLSSLVEATDTDGVVDPTSAVYDPIRKRLYVLLGNIDLSKVALDGFTYLCSALDSTLIAIDTTNDTIVGLGGAGPGGGIVLPVHNPLVGVPLIYDAVNDRVLVLGAGCNQDLGGGVAGPIAKRGVAQVSFTTNTASVLLDLNAQGFPANLLYIDSTHAVVGFFGSSNFWDPTQTSLGAAIDAPDTFAYDGVGGLDGVRATFLGDGGPGPVEVIRIPVGVDAGGDGGDVTVLTSNPFTVGPGFVGSVEVWPHL